MASIPYVSGNLMEFSTAHFTITHPGSRERFVPGYPDGPPADYSSTSVYKGIGQIAEIPFVNRN